MVNTQNTPPVAETPTPQSPTQPSTSNHNDMGMSPRTLFLIIALAVCAIFFFIIAVYTKPVPKVTTMTPTPTPELAKTTLALVSEVSSASGSVASATNTIDVTINTNTNPVTAAQIELSFDPKILTNVSVSPGTFFNSPVELLKKIDTTTGRISYALGIQPQDRGVAGSGIVAKITYGLLPTTDAQTVVSFLPKTIVTAQGIGTSVLKSTIDLAIQLKSAGIGGPSPSSNSAATSPTKQ